MPHQHLTYFLTIKLTSGTSLLKLKPQDQTCLKSTKLKLTPKKKHFRFHENMKCRMRMLLIYICFELIAKCHHLNVNKIF